MDNIELLMQALRDAMMMSEQIIACFKSGKSNAALNILENRSRVINIIFHLDEKIQISPTKLSHTQTEYFVEMIQAIKNLDSDIEKCLAKEKMLTQNEIAKTHKNKENLKGYNLNIIK